jgi:biotin carboxyl carrier protein
MKLEMLIDGTSYEVEFSLRGESPGLCKPRKFLQSAVLPTRHADQQERNEKICRSPVSGIVRGVHVHAGDELQSHDLILVLEAMKMQTRLTAPSAGKLKCVKVSPGQAVKRDQVLVEFE